MTDESATTEVQTKPPQLVLVTGGTGFIGAHIIQVLVEKKYRVRATVRKLKEKDRYEKLYEVCGDPERAFIEFVEVDLESSPEQWDAAIKDCDACIHTASPVKLTVKDPEKELLEPILQGVANVLGACHRSGTVKRVVFTSSITALSESFEDWKRHVYGAKDWNTTSSTKRNPYAYAKTMAERACWEFVRVNKSFSLATILPYVVVGPYLIKPPHLPDTMDMPFRGALEGQMWLTNYAFGLSDVRDTAQVHVAAMEHLPIGGEAQTEIPRYIVWTGAVPYKDMVKALGDALPDRKKYLPKGPAVPNWVILSFLRLTAAKGIYRYMKTNLYTSPKFDVENVEKELGIKFRPWQETIRDTAVWIKEAGFLDQHKKKA